MSYHHNFATTQAIFKQKRLACPPECVGSPNVKITCNENTWDFKFVKFDVVNFACSTVCTSHSIPFDDQTAYWSLQLVLFAIPTISMMAECELFLWHGKCVMLNFRMTLMVASLYMDCSPVTSINSTWPALKLSGLFTKRW